jgi:hypothetical protein
LLKRFEILFREIEERLVVVAQSISRKRFEGIGEFCFGVVQQRDFVLIRFAFLFETGLERRETGKRLSVIEPQLCKLLKLAVLSGETFDQRRAFSLTLSAAAFEFVFELRPGDEPEGNSADDQTDDQHRHGEDDFHGRSFYHSFGRVSIILFVGASSTAINCVVPSVTLESSAGSRVVGSSFVSGDPAS